MGRQVLCGIPTWRYGNKMPRWSESELTGKYMPVHVPKVLTLPQPTLYSLSELREEKVKDGMSTKSFYKTLRRLTESPGAPARLVKGPWPSLDGQTRNRIIVMLFPLVAWGFNERTDAEVDAIVNAYTAAFLRLNPSLHPHEIRSRPHLKKSHSSASRPTFHARSR